MHYADHSNDSNLEPQSRVHFVSKRSLVAFLLAFPLITDVNAQVSDKANLVLQNVLNQIHAKRDLAEQALARMPNRVPAEVAAIMKDFDNSLAARVQEKFAVHYEDVEISLDAVSLPADLGNLELVWEQVKKGIYDSQRFDGLVESFINEAHKSLEPHREVLGRFLELKTEQFLVENLKRAEDNIWAPYAELPGQYFPSLQISKLPGPAIPPTRNVSSGSPPSSHRGYPAIAGASLLLLRRIPEKIASRVPDSVERKFRAKLLAKVAAKAIPILGTLLVAFDAWDATRAKVDLERKLRQEYLSAYKAAFSTQSILYGESVDGEKSFRSQVESTVGENLFGWASWCGKEIERWLAAAEVVMLSSSAKDYVQSQIRIERKSGEIVEDLFAVQNGFPPNMIQNTHFRELLEVRRAGREIEDTEFRYLMRELGSRLLREYSQHREEVFLAAHTLGLSVFLEVFRSRENVDWYTIRSTFERYDPDMSEPARRGLLLSVQQNVAQPGIPSTTLSTIHQYATLFSELVFVVPDDSDKLFRIFADPSLPVIIGRALDEIPDAARAFVRQWDVQAWTRYRSPERFDALLAVAKYRALTRKQRASDLSRELADREDIVIPRPGRGRRARCRLSAPCSVARRAVQS